MAGSARDASIYQSDFLTNRNLGETFEAYSALVWKNATLTRAHYAVVVIVFAVNLFIPLGLAVFLFAVRNQPTPSTKVNFTTNSSTDDWMACRSYVTNNEQIAQTCAVIDDDFCQAASKVISCPLSFSALYYLLSESLSTLSQKSATVAEFRRSHRFRRQSHFSATVWTGLKVSSTLATKWRRVTNRHRGDNNVASVEP